MKTTLILGSGVSYYSGMPKIDEITEIILNSKNIKKNLDENYYIADNSGIENEGWQKYDPKKCQDLIRLIKNNIDDFYKLIKNNHATNYEDIYYVLKQIDDSYQMEFENPAILKLTEFLLAECKIEDLNKRTKESIRLIECMVFKSIDKPIYQSDQFNIINDIVKTFELNSIVSLNHDLVLENWLEKNKIIEYDDGFKIIEYELPEWVGFQNNPDQIKLCKIHGSVDWFEFCFMDKSLPNNILKRPIGIYLEQINDHYAKVNGPTKGMPEILIGTFNKMLGYFGGIHKKMHDELEKNIKNSELIIVSGYGFGDKGINTNIFGWLGQPHAKKMIVIHPDKEVLLKNSRGNFKNLNNSHPLEHNKISLIQNKFENVSIEEIKKWL